MKKGARCIAQTLNRSQPQSCPRPVQQMQRLANEEVRSPCPKLVRSPYASPGPVTIRVCTRRDIERTLEPPKSCECSPWEGRSEIGSKRFSGLVKNVAKSAIAAGLVYWTSAEGVWGDGQESEELYRRIIATVAPAVEEAAELEDIKLPHLENVKYDVLDAYNRSVLVVFGLLVGVPMMLKEKVCEIFFPNGTDEKITGESNNKLE